LAYGQALYDSGEIEPDCFLLGHAINQMPFVLMAAIGIGDEIDGTDVLLEDMLWRMDRQMPGYRHFLERDCFQQSYSYTCTYVGEFPYLFQAIESGLGTEMFQANAWFANVVKWWTYPLRDDETFIRFGDYFCSIPLFENAQYYRPLAAIATHYRDGLARWWVNRFRLRGAEPDQILFEDRNGVEAGAPNDLPRTKLFGPMGIAIARGNFEGDGATIASFKCTPVYLHNHGHRDANSFTIYHKGDLAIDSGAYDAYETPHWYNYYIRTIAHNTIVVHDPEEKLISRGKEYANDGGQRFVNEPHFQARSFEEIADEAYRDGEILAYREGDGFSYVCGDASNCYRKEKLKRFVRHVTFVLDWPGAGSVSLVVLDELELSRPGLKPRFLLHTMEEPRVQGNTILASHGGLRRAQSSRGRLTATVLLPRQPHIETIGGPGREFEVDGKNYPLTGKLTGPHTPGAWRAEITGGQGPLRQFLTLLVPADLDAPPDPPARLEESAAGWVVKQGELTVELLRPGSSGVLKNGEGRVIRVELAG
jgi:heparin/heparan-sulfate lyase